MPESLLQTEHQARGVRMPRGGGGGEITNGIANKEGAQEVDGVAHFLPDGLLNDEGVLIEALHHHASGGMHIKEADLLPQRALKVQCPNAICLPQTCMHQAPQISRLGN